MRILHLILILLLVSANAFSQDNAVQADTFKFSRMFSYRSIIIRSDSTFCERNIGCISSTLRIGTWHNQCENLILTYSLVPKIDIRSESYYSDDKDSLVTFSVRDWKGNPLKWYLISFVDNSKNDTSLVTDENGIIQLKRNSYSGYYSETDEDNMDYTRNVNDIIRFLSHYTKTIIITLSLPEKKDSLNSYVKEFTLLDKEMIDLRTKLRYSKKQTAANKTLPQIWADGSAINIISLPIFGLGLTEY